MTRDHLNQLLTQHIITIRQHQILELRRRGFSQYQIAEGLHISRSTVRSLERTALDKITRNTTQIRKENAA